MYRRCVHFSRCGGRPEPIIKYRRRPGTARSCSKCARSGAAARPRESTGTPAHRSARLVAVAPRCAGPSPWSARRTRYCRDRAESRRAGLGRSPRSGDAAGRDEARRGGGAPIVTSASTFRSGRCPDSRPPATPPLRSAPLCGEWLPFTGFASKARRFIVDRCSPLRA
jgi:hypothetical protein